LRDRVKIIIGGGIVTEKVGEYVGADAFTNDASEGVDMCRRFAREGK
jgi:methanogenic corrinoid protein MtbC1